MKCGNTAIGEPVIERRLWASPLRGGLTGLDHLHVISSAQSHHMISSDQGHHHVISIDQGHHHVISNDQGHHHVISSDQGHHHVISSDRVHPHVISSDQDHHHVISSDQGYHHVISSGQDHHHVITSGQCVNHVAIPTIETIKQLITISMNTSDRVSRRRPDDKAAPCKYHRFEEVSSRPSCHVFVTEHVTRWNCCRLITKSFRDSCPELGEVLVV